MQATSHENQQESNDPPSPTRPSVSPWVKFGVLLLVLGNVTVLGVNAATTSIWEDEANGFYLAHKPLPEMMEAMLGNLHEDPPLFDLTLHGWIQVVGRRVAPLRSLSILFWVAMIPGLFFATRRLAGSTAAWMAVGIACLMPNHWLFPAAMRWYSLFSCLSIWNFYCFLVLLDESRQPAESAKSLGVRVPPIALYALTGAGLWYTNYSAPVLFFAHLVVALIASPSRLRIVAQLAIGWMAISLMYVPWLPTFFRQMDESVHHFSPVTLAISLWVLAVGEFSTPLDPWMVRGVVAMVAVLAVVVAANIKRSWIPLLIVLIVLVAMGASGVVWTKRVLFLVPLLAMTIALALSRRAPVLSWLTAARATLVVLGIAVSAASFVHMVRREHWLSYRWLDPIETALTRAEVRAPGAIVLTNSNPTLFYLHDDFGKVVYSIPPKDGGFHPRGLYYPFADHLRCHYEPDLEEADAAVYLHHWAYGGPLSNRYDAIVRDMRGYGFEPVAAEALLRMPDTYLEHHPLSAGRGDPTDPYRVVLLYFRKAASEGLPAANPDVAMAAGEGVLE